MKNYQLELRQIVDFPRCRIYREFVQDLLADRSIRTGRMLRSFLFCSSLLLCQLQNLLSAHRRDLIHGLSRRMDLLHRRRHRMVPCALSLSGICNPKILAGPAAHYIYPPRPRTYRKVFHYRLAA